MPRDLYHPDEPMKRVLTPLQQELLLKIVRTNGGGISRDNSGYPDSCIIGLVKRHLIQGKAAHSWMMVHTREGLEEARRIAAEVK
jgi:hypothetical protein